MPCSPRSHSSTAIGTTKPVDVATIIRRGAREHSAREAVVCGDERLTYSEVFERGIALAAGLAQLGLVAGDRIGVLADNSIVAMDAFLGLGLGGYARVPLYARNASTAHAQMLDQAGCRALIVAPEYVHEVEGLVDSLPSLEHVLVTDAGYASWLSDQSSVDTAIELADEDLFALRFTGGTTGAPKGVPTTHGQFCNQVRDWFYTFPPPGSSDAVLHAAPITHASGSMLLPLWAAGGRNVLMPTFDPKNTLALIERERISYMFLPPTAINALARQSETEPRDTSSLKVLMSAAAPITEDTALRARKYFGDVLYQGYGLSEGFPLTMMSSSEWFANIEGSEPLRSCGKALPFARLEVWDDRNRPLALGEEGEIVARCDGQMDGYWNSAEETAETLVDGWLKTGDIGRIDEKGYVYILDRKKDMIISGGFNLYPAEIENAIAAMPSVVEVAVVGVPDERWGESPLAVVVADSALQEAAIIEHVAASLGAYKKPREVVISAQPLPKTPVGKLDRKRIREPYWRGKTRRVAGA